MMRVMEMVGAAAAIAAAIAGAGFASGREIVTFFAGFGVAGYAGACLAAALVGLATRGIMLLAARSRAGALPGLMRCALGHGAGSGVLCVLLLTAVSAAMTAAGGELGALMVNIHGARQLGMAVTAALAALAAARGLGIMSLLGGVTVAAVLGYFLVLAGVEPTPGPAVWRPGALTAAVAYAGFNIATACGVVCAAGLRMGDDARRESTVVGALTGGFMLALLLAALVCVRLHWSISEHAAMPGVLIAARLGKAGYYLTIAVMWMAVLSTLAGALLALELQGRDAGLHAGDVRALALGAAVLLGCAGFENLVNAVYPPLGLICAGYIAVMLLRSRR